MTSREPYPIRLIRMSTYDMHLRVNVNVSRAEMAGSLPTDPARWSRADLMLALESGVAVIDKVHGAVKEDS